MSRSPPRRYQLNQPDLDAVVDGLVARAVQEYGDSSSAEHVRQMLVTSLRLLEDSTGSGDVKLLNNALKELRHSMRVFSPHKHVRKVAVFGSARTPPTATAWQQAHTFSEKIVQAGWMVITGAGPGIMEAAQGGAGRRRSFGVNIRLPFEQHPNDTIRGDGKLINFRYFFTRKVVFVKESHAIALFPGGFGTHDEGFESLTLIQTGKSELVPVVYVDEPGGSYWKDWEEYVRTHLHRQGLISSDDLALFKVTDDVEVALQEILNYYSNYHSSRYVKDRLVLRVRRAPEGEQLDRLNQEFAAIVTRGSIEVRPALLEEGGEAAELPRVVLNFDRKSLGKLRLLIDRLNELVPETASSPTQASPHEIVENRLSDEAELAEETD